MTTEVTDRLKDLKSALQAKVSENDEIITALKVGEEATGDKAGVIVTSEQKDRFQQNLKDGEELKAEIALLEGQTALHEFLDAPSDPSAAMKAAAAAAAAGGRRITKTIGELFTDSDEFRAFRKMGGYTMQQPWEVDGVDLGSMWTGRTSASDAMGQKDIYTQLPTANPLVPFGFGPVQVDSQIVPLAQRTVRVRDLFPVQPTTAAVIEFFRVTGFINEAGTVPERTVDNLYGMKPHSNLTFVGTTAPVRTIAHWETAHRNTLDDVQQLQGIVNNELLYGLRLAEDGQILNGSGSGEDILGILNTPGIQGLTRASGDNFADAVRRAMTRSFLAYYEPTGVVLHPIDWEGTELLKTTFGQYILATNVAVGAVKQVWRLPVVDTPAIQEGTGLVGAFGIGATLYDRMIANIRIAEQHADLFVRNAIVVLAEERIALAVKRPESFVKVTF